MKLKNITEGMALSQLLRASRRAKKNKNISVQQAWRASILWNGDRLVAWGNVTSSKTPLHPVHQLAFSRHIFTYQRRCCHCSLRVHTRALGPQRPEGQGKTAEEQGYMKIAYWANSGPWNIILKELYWFVPVVVCGISNYAYRKIGDLELTLGLCRGVSHWDGLYTPWIKKAAPI